MIYCELFSVIKKHIKSGYYLCISFGIGMLLSGCHGGVNQPKSDIPQLTTALTAEFPANSIYNLGGTYDSFTNTPTPVKSCSKYGNNLDNIVILNPSTKLDFTQRVDYATIKSAIGMEYSAKINLGFAEVHIHQQFAKTTQDDSLNLNLNYAYKYAGTAVFDNVINNQGEQLLTPDADAALNTSAGAFRSMCGDGMITQLDAGVTLLLRLNLNFNSHSEKNIFDETVTHLDGLQGVIAKLKQQQQGSNFTITASALQLGGNPQLLNQLFLRHGGSINADGYPDLVCADKQGDSHDCVGLIDEILDYSTSLKQQLNSKSDYYYSTPAISRWNTLGIDVTTPRVSPEASNAFQKMNQLADNDQYYFKYSKEYLVTLQSINGLDVSFISQIRDIRDFYQKLNNLYNDKRFHLADNCAIGYIGDACVNSVSNFIAARNELINQNKDILNLGSYLLNNMYSADLVVDAIDAKEMSCDILPISDVNTKLFAVDCDGNVTKDQLTVEKTVANKLLVKNLNYQVPPFQQKTQSNINYNNTEPLIKFTYDLSAVNDELKPNSYYDFLYQNPAIIHSSSGSMKIEKRLDISNVLW